MTLDDARATLQAAINAVKGDRDTLEAEHGQVWDTTELQRDFTVQGFMAPFVVVTEKATGRRGSLAFQHSPRFYFDFTPDLQ